MTTNNRKRKYERGTVWLDGQTLMGQVAEIELPEMAWEMVEDENISNWGTTEFPSRLEAMECTLKWASWTEELAAAAANPFRVVNLQCRLNFGEYGSGGKLGDRSVVVNLTGRFKSNNLGSYDNEEMDRESVLTCTAVSEKYEGREIFAIDIEAFVYRVEGQDLMVRMRENLGMQ